MHTQNNKTLIFLISAVVLSWVLALSGYFLTTHAEGTFVGYEDYIYDYSFTMSNRADLESNSNECTFYGVSKYPVYAYHGTETKIYFVGYDKDNDNLASVTNKSISPYIHVNKMNVAQYDKDGKLLSTIYDVEDCSLESVGTYFNNYSSFEYRNANSLVTKVPIFDSKESLLNYIYNGDDSGQLNKEPKERDFGEDYDPSVPVPQLTNISHGGFDVANAADDLEIDVVVKSSFYGLKHKEKPLSLSENFHFNKDNNWLFSSHYYDCTLTCDVGYYKSSYDLAADFKCNNLMDLVKDGQDFYSKYPKHTSLPDYDFFKYFGAPYDATYYDASNYFENISDDTVSSALKFCRQAVTKYYVRFYKIDWSNGVMKAGQWYCYTYSNDGSNGNKVVISPVRGDKDGNPVETDPNPGRQDDDGGWTPDKDINIDTSDPLKMIQSFIDFVKQLPSLLGDLSAFLADAFCFIPSKFWDIIFAGVGFSVVFLIFRAVT